MMEALDIFSLFVLYVALGWGAVVWILRQFL